MTNYDYYYSDSSTEDLGVALAVMFTVLATILFFLVVVYVVTAFFQYKLLKNVGHKTPASAWVPVWNTITLMETGGVRKAGIWTLILFAGSFVAGLIPFVGFFISLAIFVVAIILTIYMVKGVHAGLGKEDSAIGGIILAILVPVAWIIWMAIESGKAKFSPERAVAAGGKMPMNWFGEGNPYAPFTPDNQANAYHYANAANGYPGEQTAPPAPPAGPYGQAPYSAPFAQPAGYPESSPAQSEQSSSAFSNPVFMSAPRSEDDSDADKGPMNLITGGAGGGKSVVKSPETGDDSAPAEYDEDESQVTYPKSYLLATSEDYETDAPEEKRPEENPVESTPSEVEAPEVPLSEPGEPIEPGGTIEPNDPNGEDQPNK